MSSSSPAAVNAIIDAPATKTETTLLSGRTPSGGFQTSEGTLYVSKPFPASRKSKRLRALVTFAPRKSHFDNESSGMNEFRGFFTLFWISMFLFTVSTYIRSLETRGYALGLAFAASFSRDALMLALSDALLVSCTALCVPFAKLVSKGHIRYYWAGVVLQHTFQTVVLFVAVKWTFTREWPWVQSGFLTLHSFVMIMKMHSYMTVNGTLHYASTQTAALFPHLCAATESVGGWEQALTDAQAAHDAASTTEGENAGSNAGTRVSGTTATYVDVPTATALRKRLLAVTSESPATSSAPSRSPSPPPEHPEESPNAALYAANILSAHPNEEISALARQYVELDSELVSTGPARVRWPSNITLRDFTMYQLTPVLVYELEYPRTARIRPGYVLEKTVAFFGTFALLYTVVETFIIPLTPTREQSFARSLLDLALPFMMAYLLLFYAVFECICNGFAELSYFADRQFYEDWWNSTSWDEFSRKWNKPVHTFLLRHVYASTITGYGVSRTRAMVFTFLLSAAAHELVMAVVTQKFRLYLFALQLIQIPLIAISRMPVIKQNKTLGNIVFWLGLYAGFPLLCVAYVAY